MVYFNKSFFQFFSELEKNNNKDWFDVNRSRYEKDVKKIFEVFITDLNNAIKEIDDSVLVDPKNAIFRINRDIRFSKDKTPYKLNRSAAISPGGKKDHDKPGYYIEISNKHIFLAGGAWMPSTQNLYKIRQEISYNLSDFEKILNQKDFKKYFGTLQGEAAKIIPAEFKEDALKQPIIKQKQFYFAAEFPTSEALKDTFLETVVTYFKSAVAINNFLRQAME